MYPCMVALGGSRGSTDRKGAGLTILSSEEATCCLSLLPKGSVATLSFVAWAGDWSLIIWGPKYMLPLWKS